jgi:hypothetical protein
MAYMPEQLPEPEPKMVAIGIMVEHGKIRVVPERVRVRVGHPVAWVVLSFDGLAPVSLQVYFDDRSPFEWSVQSVQVHPEQKGPPRRHVPSPEQPVISGAPDTPGDYKYGVRILDVYGDVLDDEDPYITVVSRL